MAPTSTEEQSYCLEPEQRAAENGPQTAAWTAATGTAVRTALKRNCRCCAAGILCGMTELSGVKWGLWWSWESECSVEPMKKTAW